MSHKTAVGKLTHISDPINGIEFFFELEDGTFREILFKHRNVGLTVPLNTKIALCMEEGYGGVFTVCEHAPFYTVLRDNA
jgi:hypothetical protein